MHWPSDPEEYPASIFSSQVFDSQNVAVSNFNTKNPWNFSRCEISKQTTNHVTEAAPLHRVYIAGRAKCDYKCRKQIYLTATECLSQRHFASNSVWREACSSTMPSVLLTSNKQTSFRRRAGGTRHVDRQCSNCWMAKNESNNHPWLKFCRGKLHGETTLNKLTYIDFVVADLGLTRRKLTRRKRDLADQK